MNHAFWSTPAGEKLTKRVAQRRAGAESDLDGAIMLLASRASRYMTGSVITVDGGSLLDQGSDRSHLNQSGKSSSKPFCYEMLHNTRPQRGITMRALTCLAFLLVATSANAQSTTTTVNRETHTVTTTGSGYAAVTTQTARSATSTTYTTTVTKTGGYQPMGAGGYKPFSH